MEVSFKDSISLDKKRKPKHFRFVFKSFCPRLFLESIICFFFCCNLVTFFSFLAVRNVFDLSGVATRRTSVCRRNEPESQALMLLHFYCCQIFHHYWSEIMFSSSLSCKRFLLFFLYSSHSTFNIFIYQVVALLFSFSPNCRIFLFFVCLSSSPF